MAKRDVGATIPGFLVVIIAVIVVALVAAFLTGAWQGLLGPTTVLAPPAGGELAGVLKDMNFALSPDVISIQRGDSASFSAGVRNNASDGKAHSYILNIIPAAAGGDVLRSYPGCISVGCIIDQQTGMTLSDSMISWISWIKQPASIEASKSGAYTAVVRVSSTAKPGVYEFQVHACSDRIRIEDCGANAWNWGKPQKLTIMVE